MILDKIVEKKLERIKALKAELPFDNIVEKANNFIIKRRSFFDTLNQSEDIAIIGEIKKASPSKGLIKADFDVTQIAKEYEKANIQALSVLTEHDFFLGDTSYLISARANCTKPVLRKDFIIDKWQIYESYLMGADAILLIVAILDNAKLKEYLDIASILGLDALVEVHDEIELKLALEVDAKIIGINNRNLNDFTVSLKTTEKLMPKIPKDKIIVAESGIHTSDDVTKMKNAGVNALLIGEFLMRADNIPKAISTLRGN